jgi:hypothetical protein
MNTSRAKIYIDYSGNYLGQENRTLGLLDGIKDHSLNIEDAEWHPLWLIGENEGYQLYYYVNDNFDFVFILQNEKSKQYCKYHLPSSNISNIFYDPWNELIKLRNGILFIVTYHDKNVIINQIRVKDMFQKLEN